MRTWGAAGRMAADDLPLTGLTEYGLAGIILTIFLTFAWVVYKRERDRADTAESEVRRLNGEMHEMTKAMIPVLEKANTALNEANRALTISEMRRGP